MAWVGQGLHMLGERDRASPYNERGPGTAAWRLGDDVLAAATLLLVAWQHDQDDQLEDRRRNFEAAALHARRAKNLYALAMALFGISMSRDIATREDALEALAFQAEMVQLRSAR